MHSVTRTFFLVFAFKVTHRVILLTRFCKLHCISQSHHTVWGVRGGGHVSQVPPWHDASALFLHSKCYDSNSYLHPTDRLLSKSVTCYSNIKFESQTITHISFAYITQTHTLTIEGCLRPLSRWMWTSFNTRWRTIGSFTNLSVILLKSICQAQTTQLLTRNNFNKQSKSEDKDAATVLHYMFKNKYKNTYC